MTAIQSLSEGDLAALNARMDFYDSRPEVERRLLQEFDPADVGRALAALSMRPDNADWDAVERMLYWARSNMNKHSPIERAVRLKYPLDKIERALLNLGKTRETADWAEVEKLVQMLMHNPVMVIQ